MPKHLSSGDDESRSTRHSKITGDFGERMTLYLLSREGFECAYVDHTGMDIIARNRITNELMGISVKSRSRNLRNERGSLNIPVAEFKKLERACKEFGCEPYYALVIDATKGGVFVLRLSKLKELSHINQHTLYWNMNALNQEKYKSNREIKWFTFEIHRGNWWDKTNKLNGPTVKTIRSTR